MADQAPTNAQKFALIAAIRAEAFLYDPKHPDYHNLEKKRQTWAQIAATPAVKLGDGSRARATFNKMRTVYNRNDTLKRSGGKHIRWQFYEAMTFLDRFRESHADCRCDKPKSAKASRSATAEKQEVEWEMDYMVADAVPVPMPSEDGPHLEENAGQSSNLPIEPAETSQNVAALVRAESDHLTVRYTPANGMILNATHASDQMTFCDFRRIFNIPQNTQKVFIFKRTEEEWDVIRDDEKAVPAINGRVEVKVYSDD